MARFKNISPQGDLELPLIGRVVEAGEEFDVAPHEAALLQLQPDLWEPVIVDFTKLNLDQLKELATGRGITAASAWLKQDYVDALTADTNPTDDASQEGESA